MLSKITTDKEPFEKAHTSSPGLFAEVSVPSIMGATVFDTPPDAALARMEDGRWCVVGRVADYQLDAFPNAQRKACSASRTLSLPLAMCLRFGS